MTIEKNARRFLQKSRLVVALALAIGVQGAVIAAPAQDSSETAGAASYAQVFNGITAAAIRPSNTAAKLARANARLVSKLAVDQNLYVTLNLPLRNESELDKFLQDVQDPRSADYHKYLDPEAFSARFGPTREDYAKVMAWVAKNGFTISEAPSNRLVVSIQGNVNAINKAFHVTLNQYSKQGDRRVIYAPSQEPSTDIGIPILSVSGLDNINPPESRILHPDVAANRGQLVSKAGGSGPQGNFTPHDIRLAYYGTGPLTGKGQTVAIYSNAGLGTKDLDVFYKTIGATKPAVPIKKIPVNGFVDNNSTNNGGEDENILDITNVLGVAPGLKQILFYEGDRQSISAILSKIASDNQAKVISNSWIYEEDDTRIFKEFQAQGQTFINASGDYGAYNADTYGQPSENPEILNVGGTSLATTKPGGAWKAETTWSGSGGGFYAPTGYLIPSYQKLKNVINATNKGSIKYRNDPDVALEADFDNISVQDGTPEYGVAGTSYAAPRMAGLIALANEKAVSKGQAVVGFINPKLYSMGVGTSSSKLFHDITTGNNAAGDGAGPSFNAVAGFDLATGWGSVIGADFIDTLIAK